MAELQQKQVRFEVDIGKLRESGLFVAIPMYGGACYGSLATSLMKLAVMCEKHGIRMRSKFLYNESLVQRARNYLADHFLRSDCQQMIFIDADIEFNEQDVLILADLQNKNPEYDVICGPYPKKCIAWEKVKTAVDRGFADENPDFLENFVGDYVFNAVGDGKIYLDRPCEIAEGGTGFMMIRRETFEKFQKAYPRQSYRPDHIRTKDFDGSREIYAFFDCVIDHGDSEILHNQLEEALLAKDFDKASTLAQQIKEISDKSSKRYLSEDYYFCRKIRAIGMKVWLAPWVQLRHNGYYSFGGSLSALAAAGENTSADVTKLKKK